MNNIQTSELVADLEKYRKNPNAIQRAVYSLLGKASDGRLNIIDPSNPFSLLLEASAVMNADALTECEVLTRRTYPKLVTTENELYGHISDMEYVGVWGSPSTSSFIFMFNVDELRARSREIDGSTNRKLVIPRETRVTVANADFSFAYPIEIIFAASGSISVLYDTTEESPFMALETNVINFKTMLHEGKEGLMFEVVGMQYSVDSSIASLSSSSGFSTVVSVPNHLYYCRVHHKRMGGDWEEMVTTHSGQVYDGGIPTATLKYADNLLHIKVPEIYFNKGLMGVEIRYDIYTTKGEVQLALGEYPATSVGIKWSDLNPLDGGKYTAVLSQLTHVVVVGTGVTSGGRAGLSFEELQNRTVRNSTYKPAPVTEYDLNNTLSDLGYDILSVVDNVTDRKFIASRAMPAPTTGLSSSPIGTTVESIRGYSEILSTLGTVNFSNLVWSIMPDTLYKRDGVGMAFVSDIERQAIEVATGDELISLLEQEEYFFSPFLTTLDTNDSMFKYNNYYIDNPVVTNRYFGAANSKVDFKATVSEMAIYRTANGYELTVTVTGSVGHEELDPSKIGLQLAFRPGNQIQRTYIDGVNGGRVDDGKMLFRFPLDTEFEVLKEHQLQMDNFNMVIGDTLKYPITPDTEFDFIHYVTDVGLDNAMRDELHDLLGIPFAPEDAVVLTHETANIRLFESLDGLINRSRVSINEPTYAVWDSDVPATYTDDIYQRDVGTGNLTLVEGENGFEAILLHTEGDPVLDEDGNPVYLYRQGDYKLDEKGERVNVGDVGEAYFFEQVLLDGRYRYATESGTAAYVKTVAATTVDWVRNDISTIAGKLLARTDLLFSPKTSSGTLTAFSVVGEPKQINAAISARIDLYVNYNAYSNSAIRSNIISSVKTTVIDELSKSKISTGSIHDQLRKVVGDDVITIKVHSFNGDVTLDAFVVDNESVGCSLAKLLERQPDGSIALIDDLEINFVRHEN